jgi:hypothetical protein
LSQPDFERYYPSRFASEVEATLRVDGKDARREAKKNLLSRVVEWLKTDSAAQSELKQSAAEVIEQLADIDHIMSS